MTPIGRGGVRLAGLLLGLLLAAPVLAADAAAVDLRVRAAPIVVALELSKGSTPVGKAITAKATVSNAGQAKLAVVTVALRADVTGLVVKGGTGSLSGLKAGRSGSVQWSLCGAAPGTYILLARATVGGAEVDSPARLLVVTPGKSRC